AQGWVRVAFVEEGRRQDQPRRDVLGKALEPLPAKTDRLLDAPGLAVGIGQGGEGQRGRIPGQALLIPAYGAEGGWIIGRQGPTDRRDRVSHSRGSLRSKRSLVNISHILRRLGLGRKGLQMRDLKVMNNAIPHPMTRSLRWLVPTLLSLLTVAALVRALAGEFQ